MHSPAPPLITELSDPQTIQPPSRREALKALDGGQPFPTKLPVDGHQPGQRNAMAAEHDLVSGGHLLQLLGKMGLGGKGADLFHGVLPWPTSLQPV
jgi:hypothetical protein